MIEFGSILFKIVGHDVCLVDMNRLLLSIRFKNISLYCFAKKS